MRRDHSLNSPLLSMLAVLAGCVLYLAVPVEAVGQSQAAATSAGHGLALTEARKKVKDIGWEMEEGSICGLGMVAHKPLVDAMKYWPQEFAKR